MFIKLFKSNHQILLSFLFIIGGIIWIHSLVNPVRPPVPEDTEILYKFFFNILIDFNPIISVLLAFGLLFIQSVVLNNLVINHSLNDKNSFLPSLVYFVLMSLLPQYCTFNPILISNLVILLCFNVILKIYLKEESFAAVFNISLFISVLSLFYTPAVFFLLLVWFSFFIYRLFKWREWFISIIGFAVPYIFVSFYYFWMGNFAFMNKYLNIFNRYSFTFDFKDVRLVSILFVEVFILFSAIKYRNYTKDKIVMLRKFASVILAFYFIGLISGYFAHENWLNHLMCTFLPASIFISQFFQKVKKNWISELIFFLMIAIIIINRFYF